MSTIRRFTTDDMFRFNNINLDHLTETYNMSFYLQYMAQWPDYFLVDEAPEGRLTSYIMGKAEGNGKDCPSYPDENFPWHGHVTALTVDPDYRRLGLGECHMKELEEITEKTYDGYFVDLYVRHSNVVAIAMYEKFGYTKFRQVIGYYSGAQPEDAFDMRKALPRDKDNKSIVPLDPLQVEPGEFD
jgi:N-terminal acetyltransferase B complex catalytic subunit